MDSLYHSSCNESFLAYQLLDALGSEQIYPQPNFFLEGRGKTLGHEGRHMCSHAHFTDRDMESRRVEVFSEVHKSVTEAGFRKVWLGLGPSS